MAADESRSATPAHALIGGSNHTMLGPRLALSRGEAARALGMSLDSFERYVQPEVSLVRRGRLRLIPVRELDAWLARNAERPVAEEVACD